MEETKLMSLKEVAKAMGVHVQTVHYHRLKGHLMPIKIGHKLFFRKPDVDALSLKLMSIPQAKNGRRSWARGGGENVQ